MKRRACYTLDLDKQTQDPKLGVIIIITTERTTSSVVFRSVDTHMVCCNVCFYEKKCKDKEGLCRPFTSATRNTNLSARIGLWITILSIVICIYCRSAADDMIVAIKAVSVSSLIYSE